MYIKFKNINEKIDPYNIMIRQLENVRTSYIIYFAKNDGSFLQDSNGQPLGQIKITIFPEYFSKKIIKGQNVWEIEELICPKHLQQVLIDKAKQLASKIIGTKAILNISEPKKFTDIIFSNIINQGSHQNNKTDDIQK